MATVNTFTVNPTTVPQNGNATVTVTFTTNPGTPNTTADLTVYENGVVKGTATGIVLTGTPAEPTPVVSLGSTNVGWELRKTGGGTLTSTGGNTFNLHNP